MHKQLSCYNNLWDGNDNDDENEIIILIKRLCRCPPDVAVRADGTDDVSDAYLRTMLEAEPPEEGQ